MNKRNKLLEGLLPLKLIVFIVITIISTGITVYAGGRSPYGAGVEIVNGNTDESTKPTGGAITDYTGYNSRPIAYISFILVDENTPIEAAKYIGNNVFNIDGLGSELKGYMYGTGWPENTTGKGAMKDLSEETKDVLKAFVQGGSVDWSNTDPWWELLEFLKNSGHVADHVYNFAVENKTLIKDDAGNDTDKYCVKKGQGKTVVLIVNQGALLYQQKSNALVPGSLKVVPYSALISGDTLTTAYSSATAAKQAITQALMEGKALIQTNVLYGTAFGLTRKGVSGGVGITNCYFTNSIPGPIAGLNYYGKQYWIPGLGVGVELGSQPNESDVSFEVDATPQDKEQPLADGDNHVAIFEVRFTATDDQLRAIENQKATYTLNIKGMEPTNAIPETKVNGSVTDISSTKYSKLSSLGTLVKYTIGATPEITLEISNTKLAEMLTSGDGIKFKYLVEDSLDWLGNYEEVDGLYYMYYTAKFDVSIVRKSTSGADIGSLLPGNVPSIIRKNHDTLPGDSSASYASWYSVPRENPNEVNPKPWLYSTLGDPTGYAEIVANQAGNISRENGLSVKAQDWNVHAGIPSTENLSVAIGGQTYIYDLAGWVVPVPKGVQTVVSNKEDYNKEKGLNLTTATVTRNISFDVIIDNWWGPTNNRCTLACGGHSYSASCTGSSSATCNGPSAACGVCGWQVGNAAHNVVSHGTDKDGKPINFYCDHGQSTSSACPKNAGGTATYSHATGQWTVSATNGSWATTPGTLNSNTQAYEGGTAVFNCNHCGGTHSAVTVPSVPLIDLGYTKGYGCVHSGETNCIHRTTKAYTFNIVEQVDTYVYREITYAKVNALTDATVKDFNANVVTATGQRKVSNSNLFAYMWRANGAYSNGNGRLWFTQFVNSAFNGTWTSTTCTGVNGTGSGYWLGDVKITMHVNADSQAADVASPERLDAAPAISMMRGKELMRYDNAASQMSSSAEYQSQSGDRLSEAQCENLALHIVNAWQHHNNSNRYTVNVISDSYTAGAVATPPMQAAIQNIIGDIYAVDNGIALFDYGFARAGNVHYRTHLSTYGAKQLQDKFLSDEFSLKDVTNEASSVLKTGYKGTPSGDANNKYGSLYTAYSPGMNPNNQYYPVVRTPAQALAQYFANSTTGETNAIDSHRAYVSRNGVNLFAGEVKTTTGSYPYNSGIAESNYSIPGITRYDLITTGTATPRTFTGFYNTHYYPNIGNFSATLRTNYVDVSSYGSITDNGNANASYQYSYGGGTNIYGAAMVVSDIKIKDYIKNKVYSNAMGVYLNYNKMTDFYNTSSSCSGALPPSVTSKLNRVINSGGYKCTYYNGYVNAEGHSNVINDIVIHDPVSAEYCVVVGNGSGDYAPYVTDQRDQDQRVIYNTTEDSKKPNYVVMGNSFHFWWSDYGDFYDANGSWDLVNRTDIRGVGSPLQANSDINGGLIRDGSGLVQATGYSNNMKTTPWIQGRYISFSFPVQYKDIDGNLIDVPANFVFDISQVPCIDSNGIRVLPTAANQKQVPTGLNQFVENNPTINATPKFGWDFEFMVPTSTFETSNATITAYVNAKNNYDPIVFEQTEPNNKTRVNLGAIPYAAKSYTIQIVGRIGNLAIEDTSDFRFAELFKKAESTWLIPNVARNVNINWPNRIISTPTDIMGTNAALKGHATTSVSAVEFGTETFLGKAGEFSNFPLVASLNADNGSELFRQEQMRLGYTAYMDIDTIGNYYGYNIDSTLTENAGNADPDLSDNVMGNFSINRGPMSAKDTADTREYTMTIKPIYVLYDYENGTYHDIDLYYGKQGAYKRYWSAGLPINDPVVSLYTDLPGNMPRWNTDLAEKYITETVFTSKGFLDISAFTGQDYIGTADKIVLDAYNRTFIGSSIKNGAITWNNATGATRITSETYTQSVLFDPISNWALPYEAYSGLGYGFSEEGFATQAQRWYFTLGTPSSSYVVPASTVPDNQVVIESAHNQMKQEHPNSVILCYVAITVKGNVWELEYDYGKANGNTSINLFNDIKDIPDSVANKSTIHKTINPVGHNGITSKMSPILVMDAWSTSADDWDTYGTH